MPVYGTTHYGDLYIILHVQIPEHLSAAQKELFEKLTQAGVIADWREPNVIRVAPVPLYNSFEDVFRFAEILRENV